MADPITWGLVLQNKVLLDKIKDLIGGIDVETPISDVLDELKTLINAVDDNVDGVSGKVDVVDGVVDGIATDVDSLQTSVTDVQSTVNTIANKNLINADSIVKNVQRGKVRMSSTDVTNYVNISSVNMNKTIVFISMVGSPYLPTKDRTWYVRYWLSSPTQITIVSSDSGIYPELDWEVIEFY